MACVIKRALIIGSGDVHDPIQLKEEALKHDFVLCADGGIKHTYDLDIHVDLIIGDLDSVDKKFDDYISRHQIPVEKYPIEKNATDVELAIDYLVEQEFKVITFMGVLGGRIDHTLANIFLLKSLAKRNVIGRIVDDKNVVYYSDDTLNLTKKAGFYVSLVPLSETGIIVTLNGFYYTLKKEHIPFGSAHGISNYIVDHEGTISIHDGAALVIESKD